jgi:preprotein translocase subunit YajC
LYFAVLGFQSVPPAPGRSETSAPAVPAKAPTSAPSDAPPPGGGAFGALFPLLLVGMLVFIFWTNRSQQKKQSEAIAGLKKGDRVVTQSGLIGRLVDIEPKYAKLEIAPGVKVQVLRTSLTGRDAEDTGGKDKAEPASEKKT